jgi:8-oxo-dGTP pyrophosphatase MutT (NUDIX family)
MCRMSSSSQPQSVISAAGGVLFRKTTSGDEQVCIVRRTGHDDWTLPKGKLEPGESFQAAAHREVEEETGWNSTLHDYLGAMGYEAAGIPKVVLFWRMSPINETKVPNKKEIITPAWVSIPKALELLTYDRERDFLAQIAGSTDVHPGHSWLDRHFHLKRARARLARECEVFGVELEFLKERSKGSDNSWAHAALRHLSAAKIYEKAGEIEGGWTCLHAAQRQTTFGLDQDELLNRAQILSREAKKISSWRSDAINNSLANDAQVTPERVSFAMALRDEHFANQYHKVWLSGDQLRILIEICAPSLLLLVILTFSSRMFSDYSFANAWNWAAILAVMIFGLLGASFSCAQSLISGIGTRSIPQRVADHYVTITRLLSGMIVGLASYSFYVSKAFTIKGLEDNIGAAFTIAFIFGYTGEKLVARVANAGRDKE